MVTSLILWIYFSVVSYSDLSENGNQSIREKEHIESTNCVNWPADRGPDFKGVYLCPLSHRAVL
jgi:hypothetical protein